MRPRDTRDALTGEGTLWTTRGSLHIPRTYGKGTRTVTQPCNDPVADACEVLGGYMATLEDLLPEPNAPAHAGTRHSRHADAPEPWNGPAGRALMDAHEGIRRLNAELLTQITGTPAARRGGSDANTHLALEAIPKLAAGCGQEIAARAAYRLERWIGAARSVPGIDEARHWRPLPKRDGEALPPRCPYCGCYQLRADVTAGLVACFVPGCADSNGQHPMATMGTGPDGRPVLTWADGLTETCPDMGRGDTGTQDATDEGTQA